LKSNGKSEKRELGLLKILLYIGSGLNEEDPATKHNRSIRSQRDYYRILRENRRIQINKPDMDIIKAIIKQTGISFPTYIGKGTVNLSMITSLI
jgi:hypothetical protein